MNAASKIVKFFGGLDVLLVVNGLLVAGLLIFLALFAP